MIREVDTGVDGDVAVEERDQQPLQLPAEDVLHELQRVVVHHRVLGLEPHVRAVHVGRRVERLEEAEDALQLVPHSIAERVRHHLRGGLVPLQRGEHLVRAIQADDFSAQHRLHEPQIELPLRVRLRELVQRRDDAEADVRVALGEVLEQHAVRA